jgi:hypothetical protein
MAFGLYMSHQIDIGPNHMTLLPGRFFADRVGTLYHISRERCYWLCTGDAVNETSLFSQHSYLCCPLFCEALRTCQVQT